MTISAFIETKWGAQIQRLENNDYRIDMPIIRRVGIADLTEVEGHHINRLPGSTSHVVRFHNGGFVKLAYTDAGELLELSTQNAQVQMDKEGNVTMGMFKGPPAHRAVA